MPNNDRIVLIRILESWGVPDKTAENIAHELLIEGFHRTEVEPAND